MVSRVVLKPQWLRKLKRVTPSNEFYNPLSPDVTLLKEKLKFDLNMSTTLNHILPGNRIKDMLKYCQQNKQIDEACEILSQHCNKYSAIADRVSDYIDKEDFTNAMDSCWSSVYWFKKNLVLGPQSSQRSDDPGQNIDWPIYNQQSKTYQGQFEACNILIQSKRGCKALKMFLKGFAPIRNVEWQQNTKTKLWRVEGPSKLPANAGFLY